jgi:predicted ATPase
MLSNTSTYLREISLKRESIASDDKHPFNIPAVRKLKKLKFHPNVTFIVGENGSGKSTLLEAIATAWGFNPEGGTINFKFSTRSSHSDLSQYLRLVRNPKRPRDGFFLRAESFFNVATEIERMDSEPATTPPILNSYGRRSLHEQSHGESFLALLMHRFGGKGLYILDEPEAALSPTRQLAVLRRIHELVGMDSQFIIATHAPILMAYPHAKILQADERGLTRVEYEETEHYLITRYFISDPKRLVEEICSDNDGKSTNENRRSIRR